MQLIKLITLLTLLSGNVEAATIKQILNEKNLAIVELKRNEKIKSGDYLIAADEKNQCLLEVISISEKVATVSSQGCTDKTLLIVGRDVEKSLFDPDLLKAQASTGAADNDSTAPVLASENESNDFNLKSGKDTNSNDILFFPPKGQLFGWTAYIIRSSEISWIIDGVDMSINNNISGLGQMIAFGVSDNTALGFSVPYISDVKTEVVNGGTAVETSRQKGIQSPTITISQRMILANVPNDWKHVDVSLYFNPKDSDDKPLRSDYYGLRLSTGGTLGGEDRKFILAMEYVNYNSNADVDGQTNTEFVLGYQEYFNDILFIRADGKLSILSEEKSKGTGVTVVYPTIPSAELGLGVDFKNSNLSLLVSYYYSRVGIEIKGGPTNINADYLRNSTNFQLGYKF